ncbi:MAG: hypothetical protein AAF512_23245 [Pseudomonadota bacterium]
MTVNRIKLSDGTIVDRADGFSTENKNKLFDTKQEIIALQDKWKYWLPRPALD